jgi:protease-4
VRLPIRLHCTIGLFLTIIGACGVSATDINRIPIPDDVFYYQPAASVFGSEAIWVNPAALARYKAISLQLMADYNNGNYAKSWGVALSRTQIGLAYRRIYNPNGQNFKEFVYASGISPTRELQLGFSYRYFQDGPGFYNNRHLWNVGLRGIAARKFAWGAVFSNLNRGKVDGERTRIEQRYSLAYRPVGNKLTLATDMLWTAQTKLSDADFVFHAEFSPALGLFINGYLDSDQNFQIGVRANLLQYFVGAKSSFDKGAENGRTTAFFGLVDRRQPSIIAEPERRLRVTVQGRPAENPPHPVFGSAGMSFARLITSIHRAAGDPSVNQLLLKTRNLSLGLAQAQELRDALVFFRSQGKKVICHSSQPNNISYFVASAADEIYIPPVSQLRLVGLRAELTFLAGTLDKLGVDVEIVKIGEYKSAPEKYTRTQSSEEYRAQVNQLLDDLYDQLTSAIAEGRGLSQDSVKRLIDRGPFTSEEAEKFGLVDGLSYRDDLNRDFLKPMAEISYGRYIEDTLLNDDWDPVPVLAVVVAEGEITSDEGDISPTGQPGSVTPATMSRGFSQARSNPDVRGIVFRVNSPGGSALATDDIRHQAANASKRLPMIVSMGNVAASGGYYISTAADRLFAAPATVTGSIGIYGGKLDLSELYHKIDLGKELYTRGKYAGMLTWMRPFTEDEREKYRSQLQAFYDHFVSLVSECQDLTPDSVDALARGHVWTGRQARDNGLVDSLGGLQNSLQYAAARIGADDYRVALYPENRPLFIIPEFSLFQRLISLFVGSRKETASPELVHLGEGEYMLARMPFDLDIR